MRKFNYLDNEKERGGEKTDRDHVQGLPSVKEKGRQPFSSQGKHLLRKKREEKATSRLCVQGGRGREGVPLI